MDGEAEEDDIEDHCGVVATVEIEGDVDDVDDDPENPRLEDFAIEEELSGEGDCGGERIPSSDHSAEVCEDGGKNCRDEDDCYDSYDGVGSLDRRYFEFSFVFTASEPSVPPFDEICEPNNLEDSIGEVLSDGKKEVGIEGDVDDSDGPVPDVFPDDEIDGDDSGDESNELDEGIAVVGEEWEWLAGAPERKGLGKDTNHIRSEGEKDGNLPDFELHSV